MAPEQWLNQKVSKSNDIWALGVILYQLCCLEYPFEATTENELKNKVLNNEMKPIHQNVPVEL